MTRDEAKKIIEVLLFTSDRPLALEKIEEVVEEWKKADLKNIIDELNDDYAKTSRAFSIVEVGGGFQILTDPFYAPYLRRLLTKDKAKRLSAPSLETLAIVAYKQPVTKAEIEAIRGVSIDGVVETLLERNLIKASGRKDIIGRPFLYGTTKEFLIHFGLKSLEDLPRLQEYTEKDIELGRDVLIEKESGGTDEKPGEDIEEIAQKD